MSKGERFEFILEEVSRSNISTSDCGITLLQLPVIFFPLEWRYCPEIKIYHIASRIPPPILYIKHKHGLVEITEIVEYFAKSSQRWDYIVIMDSM